LRLPFKYFIFLLASFTCLNIAWLLQQRSGLRSTHTEKIVALVEQKVDSATSDAVRDSRKLESELLLGHREFGAFLNKTKYPVFVYEGDKLLFWSDHTSLAGFDNIHELKTLQLVENRFGKYLVYKYAVDPDFLILVSVPLEISYGISNRYLVSGLNKEVFGEIKATIQTDLSAKLPEIYSQDGTYLFSLNIRDASASQQSSIIVMLLDAGVVLFALLFLNTIRRKFAREGYYVRSILFFMAGVVCLRLILLACNFPFSLQQMGLFNPKYYAASAISPSIGDLLLNALVLVSLGFNTLKLGQYGLRQGWLQKFKGISPALLKLATIVIFYFLLWLLYHFYLSIYTNTLLVMDVTQSLQFDSYKLALLAAILLQTAAFLVFAYLPVNIFFVLPPFRFKHAIILLVSLALIFGLFILFEIPGFSLIFITFFYVAIILVWEKYFPRNGLLYRKYLFGFLVIAITAFVGSLALYRQYHLQLLIHKDQFAKSLTQENDVLGEYLLEKVADEIEVDPLIRKKMLSPLPDESFISQKITKHYLRDYFEKYESNVLVFDVAGNRINPPDSVNTLEQFLAPMQGRAIETSHPEMYLFKSTEEFGSRKYLKIIRIPVPNAGFATIVLELALKKLSPHSLIPELLVDQKYIQPLQSKSLSFAFFKSGDLLFSEGEFNYNRDFDTQLLQMPRLYTLGRTVGYYDHYAINQPEGTTLVITTIKYLPRDIWSNFSFLFLLHLGVYFFSLLVFTLRKGNFLAPLQTRFSTKIQLFLNFGILLPLVLISISIASLVTASYKKDLTENYERRGQLVQESLRRALKNGRVLPHKNKLENLLRDYANLTETDINIYNASGQLLASSQPLIFEAGLLSEYMNPRAYAALTEENQKQILLPEKAGLLDFSSLYVPLYAPSNQQISGFISLPFFDSEKELNQKLIELLTTIMNIFTAMFIVFMLLTYLAARALTVPLNMITEKLKRTTLTEENERINYAANDEIGLLVKEYNQMISKLEESRNELAVKEKEAAWREMARQVAHEIKNPLTPMKLSLQYLQKAIAEKRGNVDELISKISQTLITNIDVLSDIATSFSAFTTLPELKNERLNLASVLKRSMDLNLDPGAVQVESQIESESVAVIGDENVLTRTFNNLFLNALQAIPGSRKPFIKVALHVENGKKALVSIQDNGNGIPEEVQDKVFIPNFSTKYSGSGIGLAVAKKGIESAGGQIWFETVENEGTTFYIELPLA
jgi:two-component system nitrogen regulation sensor histidine kinase NtrY